MTWNKTVLWSVLWWITLATSVSSVYSAHNLYAQYKNVTFSQNEIVEHLFMAWCVVAFLYHFFLSLAGMSWNDFLQKLIPLAWMGMWVLVALVINTDFPYGTAFWLLIVATIGFSVPKLFSRKSNHA